MWVHAAMRTDQSQGLLMVGWGAPPGADAEIQARDGRLAQDGRNGI